MKKALGILGIDHPDTSKLFAIKDYCKIELITGQNKDKLINSALEFDIPFVVTENDDDFKTIDDQLWENDTKTYVGTDAIAQCSENENITHLWINYNNLIGLKAAIFALKSKKIVGIHELNLLFQCGLLLSEIANENMAFVSNTDTAFNFFYKTIINYDQEQITSINIAFADEDETQNFKKSIALRKLLPQMNHVSFNYFQSKSKFSIVEVFLSDGEVITHQKQCLPYSILNQWFDIPYENVDHQNEYPYSERTPLNWNISDQWYKNDAFAIAFMAQDLNWKDFQEKQKNTTYQKVASFKDIQSLLKDSNRIDLDL